MPNLHEDHLHSVAHLHAVYPNYDNFIFFKFIFFNTTRQYFSHDIGEIGDFCHTNFNYFFLI
jgi:hypothetical protein